MNIRFPLFKSDLRTKTITETVCTQDLPTQAMMWIGDGGKLHAGIEVAARKTKLLWILDVEGVGREGDVIGLYRAYLLLDGMSAIDRQLLVDVLMASLLSDPPSESADRIGAKLRPGIYDEIRHAVPKNLPTLLMQLAQAGVEIDRHSLERELDAGRIFWDDVYARFNVEPTNVRAERKKRRDEILRDFNGPFKTYLAEQHHAHEDDEKWETCGRLEIMRAAVLGAYARGVDDPVNLAGLAIYRYFSERQITDAMLEMVTDGLLDANPMSRAEKIIEKMTVGSKEGVRMAAGRAINLVPRWAEDTRSMADVYDELHKLLQELPKMEVIREI